MALSKTEAALDELTGGADKKIQLDTTQGFTYSAGQLSYDPVTKTVLADTGVSGVRVNVGQEMHVPVYNGTGADILNGTPVSGSGSYVSGVPSVVESDADNILLVLGFLGIVTADIADGEIGFATAFGAVNGVDTSSLSVAPVYLASGGGLTNTLPLYPTHRFLVGGVTVSDASVGVIGVGPSFVPRESGNKSYHFTSNGVGAGSYSTGGFYEWSTTAAALTQASPSVTHGTAGETKAAHVGIVPQGAGTVDAGQVGLRVTGTLDSEQGAQTAAQTAIITEDITTLAGNIMTETSEKFSGQVTLELYVVSGTPTTYSLNCNYGFSKYEDMQNRNITLTALDCVWEGGATDAGPEIALRHHKATGWTYAASGFVAGNGYICQRSVDQAIEGAVAGGKSGAYKRTELNTYIESSGSEGLILEVTTNASSTFQGLDIHLSGYSEEVGR